MKTKSILVGILACLGTATGLSAACPPQDQCASIQVLSTVDDDNVIDVQGFVNNFMKLQGGGCDDSAYQVVFELGDNFQPSFNVEALKNFNFDPKDFQTFNFDADDVAAYYQNVDAGAFPAFTVLSSYAQPEGKTKATRVITKSKDGDGKSTGNFYIVEDDNAFAITIKDGKVVNLDRNGKKVDLKNVKKEGDSVQIIGPDGTATFNIKLDDSGTLTVVGGQPSGQAWAGTTDPSAYGVAFAQPEPPKAMIGVQLGEPDGMLLGHFGLEAGEATLITGVYDNLPAGKAGLRPYDIIISIDGKKPAGQAEVREALRGKGEGDKVEFVVIHKGERKEIDVKLVKYDQETLEKSKLDAVQQQSYFITQGGPGDVMVAPGIGALRGMGGMDADQAREFAEKMRKQAEEFAERAKNDPNFQGTTRWQAEKKVDVAPSPARGGNNGAQWERLEERLERLEKMIERLAERQAERSKNSPKAGGG